MPGRPRNAKNAKNAKWRNGNKTIDTTSSEEEEHNSLDEDFDNKQNTSNITNQSTSFQGDRSSSFIYEASTESDGASFNSEFSAATVSPKGEPFKLFSSPRNPASSVKLSPTPSPKFSKTSPKPESPKQSPITKPNEHIQNEAHDFSASWIQTFMTIGGVIILILSIGYMLQPNNPEMAETIPNQFEEFAKKINTFESLFPSQDKRFWRTIKASGKHVLNVSSPEYPAVLLFVTNNKLNGEKNFDASNCLAKKISSEFDSINLLKTNEPPIVDCGKLKSMSSNGQKRDFDDKLRSYLDGNYKSVVVEHLELLNPLAALLLHGYCDGDNAPFKDVMIILVLHVEHEDINSKVAESILKHSWEKELEQDKVDALMSRVANNIVIVNPETSSVKKHCKA